MSTSPQHCCGRKTLGRLRKWRAKTRHSCMYWWRFFLREQKNPVFHKVHSCLLGHIKIVCQPAWRSLYAFVF
ncbi:MAG: hypothetical protein BYD32DRAFT_402944 [Podila humilis]|nr:MAG: hypothetical protein BYD32DRAFT_402944 [Podila humilis]